MLLTVLEYDGEVYGVPGERSTSLPEGAAFLGWEYSREPVYSVNLPSLWYPLVRPVSDWFEPQPQQQ